MSMKKTLAAGSAATVLMLLVAACGGSDKSSADRDSEIASISEEADGAADAPSAEEAVAVEPGIDPEMAPQEFWDEHYRENNCASQSMTHGGIAMCMARSVDTEHGGTMVVLYVDQDEAGVQDWFSSDSKQEMFTQSMAEIFAMAKHEGDPRVQHVTDLRVIASGGKGIFSGWQDEVPV
jgi:hypothetical protein